MRPVIAASPESCQVRLQQPSRGRSFFNFYFSSQPEPLANEAVFWSGSAQHPPHPIDVFSLLLSTSTPRPSATPTAEQPAEPSAMLWLLLVDSGAYPLFWDTALRLSNHPRC